MKPQRQKEPGFLDGREDGLPTRNAITGLKQMRNTLSLCYVSENFGFISYSNQQYLAYCKERAKKKKLMRRGIASKQKEQSDPEVRTMFKELIEKSNIFGI